MKTGSWKGFALALLSGFFYGIIPLIMLSVSRSGAASGTVCSMYRMFFAGILLLPAALFRSRKKPVTRRALKNLCLIGIFSGVTALLLYEAFERIPSGIGISVHYIYPLTTLLLTVLLFKEKVRKTALPAALLVLAGVVLLCDAAALPEKPVAGLLFAVASAFSCSIYYILFQRLDTGDCDRTAVVSYVNLFGAATMFLYNFCTGKFTAAFTLSQWGCFVLAGVVMIGAVTAVSIAVKSIGPVTSTVLGTLEPIVCTIGSALLLGDAITLRTGIGAALILSAVVLNAVSSQKQV